MSALDEFAPGSTHQPKVAKATAKSMVAESVSPQVQSQQVAVAIVDSLTANAQKLAQKQKPPEL